MPALLFVPRRSHSQLPVWLPYVHRIANVSSMAVYNELGCRNLPLYRCFL